MNELQPGDFITVLFSGKPAKAVFVRIRPKGRLTGPAIVYRWPIGSPGSEHGTVYVDDEGATWRRGFTVESVAELRAISVLRAP